MRVIIAVAALAAAAITARLGFWQLDRASQKQALQAMIESRATQPLLTEGDLAALPEEAAAQHHRLARLQGTWLPAYTVFLENRPMNGRAGFYVLMPLRLPDGSTVLVQRGWQPRDLRDRTITQPIPVDEGSMVLVQGRVAPPPSRLMDFAGAQAGPIRQNVALNELQQEWSIPLRPVTLLQLEPSLRCEVGAGTAPTCVQAEADGLLREWPVVVATADKNRGYAVQWFALSALVVLLYAWFQIVLPRRRARSTD